MAEPNPATPTALDTDTLVARLAAEIRKPAPATPPSREALLKDLDEAGKKGAGEYTKALADNVLVPMQASNVRAAAQINRRIVEKDSAVGPLYKRYRKEVEARAAELGGDAYIAEKGLESVIRSVAAEDPAYVEELAETRANAKIAEREAAAKAATEKEEQEKAARAAAARPPVEKVHAGAAPAPSAPEASEEEEIKAIQVTDADADIARRVFRITANDVRQQRHQIAKMEKKYGALGIRQLGGIPICTMADIGLPEPGE